MALYSVDSIVNNQTQKLIHGKWVPARPLNYQRDSFFFRVKLAWRVLTGKYDAIDWDE